MGNLVESKIHYDMLIDEGIDFVKDSKILKHYMKNWDGDLFYNALELNSNKNVFEVGVGTGRVALEVLNKGVKSFVGIDNSDKSIKKAKENLKQHENLVSLKVCDINELHIENTYDVVYSVLTFIHIKDKERALRNMVNSLKKGGIIVISLTNNPSDYLDYCSRIVKLYPENIEFYLKILNEIGCNIKMIKETENKFATIIKAVKN
ncbi:class I SAM-dependent methyltransferase [Mycoplasmatota bacterium]|nr:class I SAM-dependent methyltransferase [Mycoplasmatota bacterium]